MDSHTLHKMPRIHYETPIVFTLPKTFWAKCERQKAVNAKCTDAAANRGKLGVTRGKKNKHLNQWCTLCLKKNAKKEKMQHRYRCAHIHAVTERINTSNFKSAFVFEDHREPVSMPNTFFGSLISIQ